MIMKVRSFLKKYKKGFWITAALVLLALAGSKFKSAATGSKSQATVAQTVKVVRGAITETVDALGAVSAMPSAELCWESAGIVKGGSLSVGDHVKKGEVLLDLENNSKSIEILQAQTSLLEAQAELDKLLAADTGYVDVLKEVSYQELLLEHKYSARHAWYSTEVSDERVEAVRANYDKARRKVWELETAYEKVRKLDNDEPAREEAYEALQKAILDRDKLLRLLNQILGTPFNSLAETAFNAYDSQLAVVSETWAAYYRHLDNSKYISAAQAKVQALQNTIDQGSIIAPFSGTVTAINTLAGEHVNAGDAALQLDDLSNLIVDLEISQNEIDKIIIGQMANITFNAIPNRLYSGEVQEIDGAGSEADGVVYFTVRIGISDADELIKPGFTVNASVITNQVNDTLLVPNSAIQYDTQGEVYVMAGSGIGGYDAVPVKIGARSDAYAELISGELKEGDQLLVNQVEDITLQFGPFRR